MARKFKQNLAKIMLACFAITSMAIAAHIPKPTQNGFLYDEDRLLSAQETKVLESLVNETFEKSNVKIAIVLMDDSHTSETYAFAKEVANRWRLEGPETKGVLIYISMKERSKHIIASEAFQASYPGIDFKRIQQEALMPHFRVEKYGRGILNFVWQVSLAITSTDGKTISVNPESLIAEENFPWQNYIFIAVVFAALAGAFFYAHPLKKKKQAQSPRAGFNGFFGGYENFNGGFKNR